MRDEKEDAGNLLIAIHIHSRTRYVLSSQAFVAFLCWVRGVRFGFITLVNMTAGAKGWHVNFFFVTYLYIVVIF